MAKKNIFVFCIFLSVFAIIELLGFSAYYIILGTPYSKKEIKQQIRFNAGAYINESSLKTEAGEILWGPKVEVLHPYLGFIHDPKRNTGICPAGFPSFYKNQYIKRAPNRIIIAIMGGSFANQTCFITGEKLINFFAGYYNKEIMILNFAIGGYKQPQQLIALNYLLMSGAEFDIVINIDGFNEVTLPVAENIKYGVSPYYPRMWLNRVKNLYDPSEIRMIGKIESFKEFKRSCAIFFNEHKLYRSPTLALIWKLIDQKFDTVIASANIEMRGLLNHAESFAATGPAYTFHTDQELYSDLAGAWFNSSVLMNEICTANGIEYYHVLQPNQYLPDSKKLSPDEIKQAYDPAHPYRDPVVKGYPLLRARGKSLSEKKVHFLDLTDIFIHNDETFYSDTCCHLNQNGYNIVVDRIMEYIQSETKLKP